MKSVLRTRNDDGGMMRFRMRREVLTSDVERLCVEHMGEARTQMRSSN